MKAARELTQEDADIQFYRDELAGMECRCLRQKQSGRAFCYKCFSRLPDDLRRGLYLAIGKGFEAAYEAAYKHLSEGDET